MFVGYDSNLLGKGLGLCGWPQRTNWQFEYMGAKCIIPAVYRFPKGIVFDILTIMDETRLREYFAKYRTHEAELTPQQRFRAEQEYPARSIPVKEIWINNKQVKRGFSSSFFVSIPWDGQDDEQSKSRQYRIRRAYRSVLEDGASFACQRFYVPYPETDSRLAKIKRFLRLERVYGIRFSTRPADQFFLLNISFEMTEQDVVKEVRFEHPVTGVTHTLYFQSPRTEEIPLNEAGSKSFFITRLMYETDPALPEGDRLQFDSSSQFVTEPPKGLLMPAATTYVGIIGGADGPTAAFIGGGSNEVGIMNGLHGLPLHSCCSVPGFTDRNPSLFILKGIHVKTYDSMEYQLGTMHDPCS